MKFYKIIVLIILINTISVFSQSSDTPELKLWNGGNIALNFNMGLNTIGSGGGFGTFVGVISPRINNGAFNLYGNPAELGFLKSNQISFDAKLGLSNTAFGIDSDDLVSSTTIKDKTDSFLEDTTNFIFNTSGQNRRDTQIRELNIAQKEQLSALSIAIPLYESLVFAFGIANPVDISLNIDASGIQTHFQTVKKIGNNNTTVDIPLTTFLFSDVRLKMNTLSFGIGSVVTDSKAGKLALGLSVNRYDVVNSVDHLMNVNGMVILNKSQEYHFNDPNDVNLNTSNGETNKLFWRAVGEFEATKWGFRFGTTYNTGQLSELLSFLNISLLLDIVPEITLEDPNAYSESYQPAFIVGRMGGTDEESLDFLIDSLNLAKPNLTKQTQNVFPANTILKIPSSLTIGLDAAIGDQTIIFNFVKYFNEFSYTFDKYQIGKNNSYGIKAGFDFGLPDELSGWSFAAIPFRLLFLDIDGLILQALGKFTGYKNPRYRISGGLLFGENIIQGISDIDLQNSIEDALDLPLPTNLSIGRQYTILNNLDIAVNLFGIPDIALRFTVGYSF